MTHEEFLKQLSEYKQTFEAILSRFHHSRDDIHIDANDDALYHQKVVEIKDLLHDYLSTNEYESLIESHYKEGVANFLRSPSYDGVQKIITVIGATITRYARQATPNTSRPQSQKQVDVPSFEKITTKLRKHWLVSLAIYTVSLVASTWYVANEIFVKPRDFELESLRRKYHSSVAVTSIVLQSTGVREGTSATTIDGGCLVAVQQVNSDSAVIKITIDNGTPQLHSGVRSGDRLTVIGKKGAYFVDIQRFRGNLVDFVISLSRDNE